MNSGGKGRSCHPVTLLPNGFYHMWPDPQLWTTWDPCTSTQCLSCCLCARQPRAQSASCSASFPSSYSFKYLLLLSLLHFLYLLSTTYRLSNEYSFAILSSSTHLCILYSFWCMIYIDSLALVVTSVKQLGSRLLVRYIMAIILVVGKVVL